MSEEEIIKRLTEPKKYSLIEILRKFKRDGIENYIITKPELIQGLLDLYNKEKEKNEELEELLEEKTIRVGFENKDNNISKDKIEKLLNKYKPNQTNTFIKSQEKYIKLVKEIQELLEERN